ncbi:dUTP diphosphatase [Candidatus Woesearchaeota archaeon]|nr:dUTP diphosphatase [Candidatus Woesearchaeota archaeon]MBN2881724.1 dUTP diphosphatase [Candidatus Woesearchaeota archaeon]
MDKIRGFELVSRVEGNSDYKLPVRGTKNAAAYDFFSPISFIIKPGEKISIQTGIKSYFQADEGLYIITRSGNGAKRRVTLANNVGLVDADYYNNSGNEGEIILVLVNDGNLDFAVEKGDRIAQCWFQKVLFADDDKTIGTRSGGLGSTGMK